MLITVKSLHKIITKIILTVTQFDLNSSANRCDLFAFSAKDYPFDASQSKTVLESVQVKPNAHQFEIKLRFNETNSLVKRKHNELLVNPKKIRNDRLMPFKVLKSNYLQDSKIQYGVCYLAKSKKALEIVPVERVFDFQTDFTYLDEGGAADNALNSADKDKETGSECELHSFPLRYESNFEYSPWSHVNYVNMRERTTKEPWKPLKLVGKETKQFGKRIHFSDEVTEESEEKRPAKNCLLPKRLIEQQNAKPLQLDERINQLLINCKAIPFGKLLAVLGSDADEELIIKLLQKSAMLVQGVWVIKSEILYPGQNELAIIHDFVSYLFTESSQLKRKEISAQIRFPPDLLTAVLDRLARFETNTRNWHFLYPTDDQFLAEHNTVRQQMEVSWQIRKLQIYKNLNLQIEKFREKIKRTKQSAVKKIDLDKLEKLDKLDKPDKPSIKKRLRKRTKA